MVAISGIGWIGVWILCSISCGIGLWLGSALMYRDNERKMLAATHRFQKVADDRDDEKRRRIRAESKVADLQAELVKSAIHEDELRSRGDTALHELETARRILARARGEVTDLRDRAARSDAKVIKLEARLETSEQRRRDGFLR